MTTKLVKISEEEISSSQAILSKAAEIIRSGGLVVFPTETVYGLGADGTSEDAAKKIYAAKGRPSDNPLIIHIASPRDAEKYTYTSELFYKLAELFMPGPLTVVMRAKDTVPKATRGGLPTVAVRCPENLVARKLIELSGCPIAAPSANLSGSPSPTNARHVFDDMNGRVDMIIDGGDSIIGLESTIVKIEDDMTLTLLRPGKITPEDLSSVARLKIADAVTDKLREGETALSPGMKYRHYAPRATVTLLDGERDGITELLLKQGNKKIALIAYKEDEEHYRMAFPEFDIFVLGNKGDEDSRLTRFLPF